MDRHDNVQLEITAETNGHEHINEIIAALNENGIRVNRVY